MKRFWNEARLSDKILGGLLVLVIIGWSTTAIHANITNGNPVVEANEAQIEEVEGHASEMMTAVEAREIAIGLVGGGTVSELILNIDEAVPIFNIVVYYEKEEFQVTLNAENGTLVRLESLTTPMALSENLTAEEAIELARQHLESIGITNATLVYSYSDTEGGIPVWSVEFRYDGRDLEFYVVKETGEFLKYPTASIPAPVPTPTSVSASAPVPAPVPTPVSAPAPDNTSSSSSNDSTISRERAGEIALGISGGRLVEVSRSSHRGNNAWWVETRADGMVHEFYIDMNSGAVLQHEVERDD